MHATRARLPQKRTRKAPSDKKPGAKKAAPQAAASAVAPALPQGVTNLAVHRAERQPRALPSVEVFALVEWIAPARESWRRGELEVRRSACMPMTAAGRSDGALALTDLPGQGDPLVLDRAAIAELRTGATLTRALPGLRITLTAEGLAPALPPASKPAVILAFPARF
ncbi:MAG TPA: hypothetical protein VHA35_22955 [Dongiaceae bacterium]|jgi:hypothetical protein|nr:hypothetical protein [Dongiaceae bacterium]